MPYNASAPPPDRGFDTDLSGPQLEKMCDAFGDDADLDQVLHELHDEEQAFDLKRGEYYPELLRALSTLKHTVAALFDLEPEQVHPNYGSNGSIDTIVTAARVREISEAPVLGEGGVLMTSPTYFRNYNSVAARGFHSFLVPLNAQFHLDREPFIREMLSRQPTLVILVSPNNPTGLPISDGDLDAVLDRLPERSWMMLDRTLVNIQPEVETGELLSRYRHKNLVVLHSMSKYKSMSQHRIGVALYSNAGMASKVAPFLPLGIGLEGCVKAVRIIRQDRAIRPSPRIIANIAANKAELKRMTDELPQFSVTDFAGNYGLLLLPEDLDSRTITDALARAGVFVMGGHDLPEPNPRVLRLHTGGPPEYMTRLHNCIVRNFTTATKA